MMPRSDTSTAVTVRSWATVTSIGLGLAFLSFIPASLIADPFMPEGLKNIGPGAMPEELDPNVLPDWLDRRTYDSWYWMHLGGHIVALAVFGAIVGWMQSRRLRGLVPTGRWVGATAVGFLAILLAEIVERHVVIGPHSGPSEPLMISIGGGTLAGVAQWFVLRRRGIRATPWLGMWIVGLLVGVAAAVAAILGLEVVTRGLVENRMSETAAEIFGWSLMLLTLGSVTGAVAGAMSARALRGALGAASSGP
jgi:hypothetical protein